ncbi:MAG: hypothetical protein AAFY73_09610 [Pseudomonadota bacterium]
MRQVSIRPVLRGLSRVFRTLAATAALGLAVGLSVPQSAEAALRAVPTVTEETGYGRLVLNFAPADAAPTFSTEQFNGIFVVTFDNEIDIDTSSMLRRLRRYATVIRVSDDQKSIRFGLTRGVRVNMTPAAEQLFLDFLPETWTGDEPLLPQDVIVELARRAEEALKAQRLAEARLRDDFVNPELKLVQGRHPTFSRIEMQWNIEFRSKIIKSDKEIGFVFDVADLPDLGPINADPPPLVKNVTAERNKDETRVVVNLQDGVEVRTYREGNTMVVDMTTDALRGRAGGSYLGGLEEKRPDVAFGASTPQAPATLQTPLTVEERRPAVITPPSIETEEGEVALEAAPEAILPPRSPGDAPLELADGNPLNDHGGVIAVAASRSDVGAEMLFPFPGDVPAAIFQRSRTLWIVFDDASEYDLRALDTVFGDDLRQTNIYRLDNDATAIRLVFERPGVIGAVRRGTHWVINHGEVVVSQSRPVLFNRGLDDRGRSIMRAQMTDAQSSHRFIDPGVGDELLVVTGLPPVSGIVRRQSFVEFEALPSIQGLAFVPRADGIQLSLGETDVVLSRRGLGLRLSRGSVAPPLLRESGQALERAPGSFSAEVTGSVAMFQNRHRALENELSLADTASRPALSKRLVRFLLANDRPAEARGRIERHLVEFPDAEADPDLAILDAAADVLLGRYEAGLDTLRQPNISNTSEAEFWRTIAAARQSQWSDAAAAAARGRRALLGFPVEVQKKFHFAAAEAAIETGSHAIAAEALSVIAAGRTTAQDRANYFLLRSKLADAAGRRGDAVTALEYVLRTGYEPAIARARLELAQLDYRDNAAPPAELIERLETLAAAWRGDELELRVRRTLGRLYVQQSDHREAFETLNAAMALDSEAPITRSMYAEMQDAFTTIFSGGRDGSLQPLDAVALFYDFRNLLPVGRSGDELVRSLATQLVDLDLLDKAAELLVHQVDNRLKGAAKAQIAADAAAIYMMNEAPSRALNLLRRTRQSRLPLQLIRQRRLLESVALNEVGKADLAIELLEEVEGPDADQVRGDIHWSTGDYARSANAYEDSLGGRWATGGALSDGERLTVMRATIARSLANDEVGLEELRRKYSQLMSQSEDATAFDILSAPASDRGVSFDAVADALRGIRAIDTFMDDYAARYMRTPLIPEEDAEVAADANPDEQPEAAQDA